MSYIDNNILKGFVNQIDLANTLGGGVSMPAIRMKNNQDHILIEVKAPSIDPETFNVSLNGNKLILLSELDQYAEGIEGMPEIRFPLFSKVFDIPFYVDNGQIEAVYDEEKSTLQVILPFKENVQHLFRIIPIRYN